MLVAPISRFVVDLNRPPDDTPLYDFSATTLRIGLVPATTFSGEPVYRHGLEPDEPEISERVEIFWKSYHRCLREELMRIRDRHGHAVLLDAHSIRSQAPLLFDGTLPDLNLGSNSGRSAAASLLASARAALGGTRFSLVTDGRFKGGYITRHYGVPDNRIHALQLEMAQSAYMQEDPPQWSAALARPMQGVLRQLVQALKDWHPGHD
jgi:N-formylglutamate deformylase